MPWLWNQDKRIKAAFDLLWICLSPLRYKSGKGIAENILYPLLLLFFQPFPGQVYSHIVTSKNASQEKKRQKNEKRTDTA